MSDNTVINIASIPGDTIRDTVKAGNGVAKTQIFALDIGGSSANAEILLTAGPQLAAVSMPVVLAIDQPALVISPLPASNKWAQALAVANGATATVVSILSSIAGYKITGISAMGNGDGYFVVQVAAVPVLSGRINWSNPNLAIILPNGISVVTGSAVTVQVTNISGSTADYEATLLGE